MATTSTVDLSTLGWVKAEIDETLKQARQALEAYVESPDDESQLRFCSTHLHQVLGTLEMVELDGAAMLAQEIESLLEAVLDEEVEASDAIFDVVTRAILTLPDYLSRLQFGQPDVPIRLLPIVNELRRAHGAEPLNEIDFFSPDLSVRPPKPDDDKSQLSDEEFADMAKSLRPQFQTALLAWLRDTGSRQAIDNMVDILGQLQAKANLGVVQQLFWVANGLLEAMLGGDLEATNDRKKLLSRIDQQIRRLVDGGGKTDLRNTSEQLVKNILFELGTARAENPRVAQLKKAFDLDLLLGRVATEDDLNISELPTPEVMESVALALKNEINDAQDILAAYFDPDQEDVSGLSELVALLEKMSSTLEMLGVPLLKSLVDEFRGVCEAMDAGTVEKTDSASMIMARALLLVENSAKDMARSAADWKRQLEDCITLLRNIVEPSDSLPSADGLEVSDAELTDSDFRQLLTVVAEEIRVNLSRIEEGFEAYAGQAGGHDEIEVMSRHLGQVEGALQILGQEGAADLARRTIGYVEDLGNGALQPEPAVLDGLAVCIGTIGAYVDGLLYNRPNLGALIDLALNEIETATTGKRDLSANPAAAAAALARDFEYWQSEDEHRAGSMKALRMDLDAVKAIAAARAAGRIEQLTDESISLTEALDNNPAAMTEDALESFEQSMAALVGLVQAWMPAANAATNSSGHASTAAISGADTGIDDDDNFDEEIMEIFIEDARDSINTISNNYPQWRADASQADAMLETRRGFHTIKGSGRMVGASEIAELAWAYEELLNKIRDGKMKQTPGALLLLDQAVSVLPAMVDQLETGNKVGVDTEALRQLAHDYIQGKVSSDELVAGAGSTGVATTSFEANTEAGVTEAPQTPAVQVSAGPDEVTLLTEETGAALSAVIAQEPAVTIDPSLLDIFANEARGHIEVLSTEMEKCRESGSCFASSDTIRAMHTLAGSARSVQLGPVSEACKAMELLLQEAEMGNTLLQEPVLVLIDDIRQGVADLIDELQANKGTCSRGMLEMFSGIHNRVQEATHSTNSGGIASADASPAAVADIAPTAKPVVDSDFSKDDIDDDLLEIFYEEAVDILVSINDAQSRWRATPGDTSAVADLKRALHTFKGGARMTGAATLGDIAHQTETLITAVEDGKVDADAALMDLMEEVHDTFAAAVEELNSGTPMAGLKTLSAKLSAMISGEPLAESSPVTTEAVAEPASEPEIVAAAPAPVAAATSPEPVISTQTATPSQDLPDDKVDPDLAEIFYEEAVDLLQIINDAQVKWRAELSELSHLNDLKRALHTFKGGARMAGAMSLGEVSHKTETLVGQLENRRLEPSTDLADLLDEIHDSLAEAIEQLRSGQPLAAVYGVWPKLQAVLAGVPPRTAVDINKMIQQKLGAAEAAIDQRRAAPADQAGRQSEAVPPPVTAMPDLSLKQVSTADPLAARDQAMVEEGQGLDKSERREQIRVRTDLLDNLANYAGEVSISRARMEQQVHGLRDNLEELGANVVRFREQLRELEIESEAQIAHRVQQTGVESIEDFDPLEFDRFSKLQQLSRSLTESLHDLTVIQGSLGNFASEAETTLIQQARVNTDLQEGLMHTRMVAFSTQATRLRHIVRQTARELGKRAQLLIAHSDVELDRNVLERMIGPFEHMIRNALDHGIESDEDRRKLGKPETATIRIDPEQRGNEIIIRVSDDGRGLNVDAIHKKAIERKLMAPNARLTNEEIMQFILQPGFSTAETVTHISGRGVGMDVVHNEVRQLGGSMSVETEAGKGTTFVITLPLTLSIMQALMVYAGEQMFAVPLNAVINIIEAQADDLQNLHTDDNPVLNYQDQPYPFMHLGHRLSMSDPANRKRKVPVLLARAGTREVAIEVDGLSGTREIVVKTLGPQLTELNGMGGATIMGDGTVVLILDVAGLWVSDEAMHLAAVVGEAGDTAALPVVDVVEEAEAGPPVIMVVDDSLTVRKITSRHLQKRGMEVLTAKDGLDAVEQLRDVVPDVMLVDIEMPRMDGYELTSRVRSESRLKHIPIIMITSRAGTKHRDKALGLGVDIYMSKPYQEDTLFSNIEKMLELGRKAGAE